MSVMWIEHRRMQNGHAELLFSCLREWLCVVIHLQRDVSAQYKVTIRDHTLNSTAQILLNGKCKRESSWILLEFCLG